MRVCCNSGKPYDLLTYVEQTGGCSKDHCVGPIDIDDFDLLLTGLGTFDTQDCISVEDLWKMVELEQEKK